MATETKHTKAFYNTEIPGDWSSPEFGDVFNFLKTFSFSREQLTSEPTNDGIRNIHYGDIHATYDNEILDLDIEKTVPYLLDGLIDPKSFDEESFPALKEGDLIIADASEDYEGVCDCVELKNINGAKVVSGLHTFAARTSKEIIALGYRTYALQHEQVVRELRRIATGTSVYGVSKNNLSKVRIALPPLPEQRAIAQVLSTADAAIHTTEKLIAQKELRKKWLMQQLLTGKKRLFSRDEIGDMSYEMKAVKFTDLFQIIRSYSVSREGLQDVNDSESIYCIHYGDIHALYENEFLDFSKQNRIPCLRNELAINETDYLKDGDIIMADASEDYDGVGEIIEVLNLDNKKAIGGLHTIVLRPNGEILSPLYTAYFLSSEKVKNELRKKATGTSVYSVSKSTLYSLSLIIHSSLKEQTSIAQVLQAADKEISLLKAKAEKLREQKKGLMQVLLTGKVRLKINNE